MIGITPPPDPPVIAFVLGNGCEWIECDLTELVSESAPEIEIKDESKVMSREKLANSNCQNDAQNNSPINSELDAPCKRRPSNYDFQFKLIKIIRKFQSYF